MLIYPERLYQLISLIKINNPKDQNIPLKFHYKVIVPDKKYGIPNIDFRSYKS